MKVKLIMVLFTLFSTSSMARTVHFSPEIKVGVYNGVGIQAGLADIYNMDAIYLSYGQTRYDSSRYDERIESYRVGVQNLIGRSKLHGFQAELGLATYKGHKDSSSSPEHLRATGISFGGAYVFQATKNLGLRSGLDFNYFGFSDTFIPINLSPTVNVGINFSF